MNGTTPWQDVLATANAASPEVREGVNMIVDRSVAEGMTFAEFRAEVHALFNRLAIPMHRPGNAPAMAPAGAELD
jgi:inosine-uridine nucleoside N-ribohydrolase